MSSWMIQDWFQLKVSDQKCWVIGQGMVMTMILVSSRRGCHLTTASAPEWLDGMIMKEGIVDFINECMDHSSPLMVVSGFLEYSVDSMRV